MRNAACDWYSCVPTLTDRLLPRCLHIVLLIVHCLFCQCNNYFFFYLLCALQHTPFIFCYPPVNSPSLLLFFYFTISLLASYYPPTTWERESNRDTGNRSKQHIKYTHTHQCIFSFLCLHTDCIDIFWIVLHIYVYDLPIHFSMYVYLPPAVSLSIFTTHILIEFDTLCRLCCSCIAWYGGITRRPSDCWYITGSRGRGQHR